MDEGQGAFAHPLVVPQPVHVAFNGVSVYHRVGLPFLSYGECQVAVGVGRGVQSPDMHRQFVHSCRINGVGEKRERVSSVPSVFWQRLELVVMPTQTMVAARGKQKQKDSHDTTRGCPFQSLTLKRTGLMVSW